MTGTKHALHRSWRDTRRFHGSHAAFVALAAALVLLPGAPLGIVTTGVQALAGVLLPSALVFLVLLCNDRTVLGPWVNPPWLDVVAGAVVPGLLVLSGLLVASTLFPTLAIGWPAVVFSVAGAGTHGGGDGLRLNDRSGALHPDASGWTMPPHRSPAATTGLEDRHHRAGDPAVLPACLVRGRHPEGGQAHGALIEGRVPERCDVSAHLNSLGRAPFGRLETFEQPGDERLNVQPTPDLPAIGGVRMRSNRKKGWWQPSLSGT